VRRLPELFETRVKARSLAYLFSAGAVLGLVTLVLPHSDDVKDLELVGLATLAILIAAVVYARADRVREWQLHAVLATGTLIISLANYWTGTNSLYPILYVWTALYAFYFFDLRGAAGHMLLIAVSYAVVLVAQDPDSPVVRWVLAVGTPLIAGMLILEMLGRLRAEVAQSDERARELRQSESRTRLVLDTAPDAFISIDGDGTVITWNRAAEAMFGWTFGETVGQELREFIFPPDGRDDHDARRQDLIDAPEQVKVVQFEVDLQRRDGSTFPAEETISRVRIGGEVLISAFIRDISGRRRRQQEREALLREQAARAEAERVAEMISGMQLLVDAALAHRTLDEILGDLVTRVRGVLGADAATVYVTEEGERLVPRATSGTRPAQGTPVPFGDGFAGRVAVAREAVLEQDFEPSRIRDPAMRALGLRSLIGVPLMAESEVRGVLVVGAADARHFTAEDTGLLRLAADRVALAMEHVRVYEREHRIAETLQRTLLPDHLPQVPGLAVAARYLPAATESEVGGDWFDVIPIPGGSTGLVMGDVAGKGLAAASMVGQLRSALRAYALEGHEPARVVERLNRLVWSDSPENHMATLLYLVIDASDGLVRWVNAGHMPPLLVSGEGQPSFLEGGRSVPLGVLPFPSFEEVSASIEPGGTVVLYTDGLIERPGTHIDAGMQLLVEVVGSAPEDPDALCDHVLDVLVPEGGTADDVALLALRNTPMSERFAMEFPTQPEALASMRALLRRWLRYARGTDREIAEITTACGEAATNAIEHAGARGGVPFELTGSLDRDEVEVTVRDYGAWRAPRPGDQGRGLSLMRALMDSVEVTPSPEGTTVRLRRRLNGAGRTTETSE
jgi:PAS domain S-box-containing protein